MLSKYYFTVMYVMEPWLAPLYSVELFSDVTVR